MEDIKIICKDCGEEFVFSVRDQEFYKQQGYDNKPVRCKACRQKRKAQRENNNKENA
ncbi:MAG: zinc-ribbon domain-containing protein [Clostridia bacterium]|nr:zinc-ribbon domain-containing protein [Clostridia bacterium]